jgi:hypothetical protein
MRVYRQFLLNKVVTAQPKKAAKQPSQADYEPVCLQPNAQKIARQLQRTHGNRFVQQLLTTPATKSSLLLHGQVGAGGAYRRRQYSDTIPTGQPASVRRDLATPEPAEPSHAQPDLNVNQIRHAIRFNRQYFDTPSTRIIQDILGGPVTGSWTPDNIRAIAAVQERYGLRKDGKVGRETFRFIEREQGLEGLPITSANCLTMFRVITHPVQQAATPGPNGTTLIRGHHVVEARFSARCNCAGYQYRQFISGLAVGLRGAARQDLSTMFGQVPGGRLPPAQQEDGNTSCPSINYGHREQPGQTATTQACGEDHYMNARGVTDQRGGCEYRGEDYPQLQVTGLRQGDTVRLLVRFQGQILRNGRPVQTRTWQDIDTTVTTP